MEAIKIKYRTLENTPKSTEMETNVPAGSRFWIVRLAASTGITNIRNPSNEIFSGLTDLNKVSIKSKESDNQSAPLKRSQTQT